MAAEVALLERDKKRRLRVLKWRGTSRLEAVEGRMRVLAGRGGDGGRWYGMKAGFVL